jgi:hypothetical protein
LAFQADGLAAKGGSAAKPVYQQRLQRVPKTTALFPSAQAAQGPVASPPTPQHNALMRVLAAMLVFVGVAFGIYQYSLKKLPTSNPGTAPTEAISLTGVRGDVSQR